jgi:uncharacterized cupredoxin-like copper-binding protein
MAWNRLGVLALALAILFGGSACGEPSVRTITITIEHSHFSTGELSVAAGETIRFVVANKDPIDHEFLIGDQALQELHESGTEAHHGAKPGEISIPAGQERTTTYTFGSAPLLFGCHLPGHYAYGMRGVIRVTG